MPFLNSQGLLTQVFHYVMDLLLLLELLLNEVLILVFLFRIAVWLIELLMDLLPDGLDVVE